MKIKIALVVATAFLAISAGMSLWMAGDKGVAVVLFLIPAYMAGSVHATFRPLWV